MSFVRSFLVLSLSFAGCDSSDPGMQPDATGQCAAGDYRWATAGGGASYDTVTGAAFDADGDLWVTGMFTADTTWGTFHLTAPGEAIFVAKLDPAGHVVLARALAGSNRSRVGRIRVAPDGRVIVAGKFWDSLDADAVHFVEQDSGNGAAFFIELDPTTGAGLLGAATSGDTDSDEVHDVAVDANGDVYITGEYNGRPSFGALTVPEDAISSETGVFVAKYARAAGQWAWLDAWAGVEPSTNDGGVGYGLAVADGSVYATGKIDGTLKIAGTVLDAADGSFFTKLDAATGAVVWRSQLVPTAAGDRDWTSGIAVDAAGGVYATGTFVNTATFQSPAGATGTLTATVTGGGSDLFVVKLGADGAPAWVRHGGTSDGGITRADDIVAGGGSVIVGGYTQNDIAFDTTSVAVGSRLFVAAFDAGGDLQWGRSATSDTNDSDETMALAVSPTGVAIAGAFDGGVTFGATTLSEASNGDAFAAVLCR